MNGYYNGGGTDWVPESDDEYSFFSSETDEECVLEAIMSAKIDAINKVPPISDIILADILRMIMMLVDEPTLHMFSMTCKDATKLPRCESLDLLKYAAENVHLDMFLLISGGKFVNPTTAEYRYGLSYPPADLIVGSVSADEVRRWTHAGVKLSSNASIIAFDAGRIDILHVLVEENQDIDRDIIEKSIICANFHALRALKNCLDLKILVSLPHYVEIIRMQRYDSTALLLEFLYIIRAYDSHYDGDSDDYFDEYADLAESLTPAELIWYILVGGRLEAFTWAQARGLVSTRMVYKLAADERLMCIAERADEMGIHTYADMNVC